MSFKPPIDYGCGNSGMSSLSYAQYPSNVTFECVLGPKGETGPMGPAGTPSGVGVRDKYLSYNATSSSSFPVLSNLNTFINLFSLNSQWQTRTLTSGNGPTYNNATNQIEYPHTPRGFYLIMASCTVSIDLLASSMTPTDTVKVEFSLSGTTDEIVSEVNMNINNVTTPLTVVGIMNTSTSQNIFPIIKLTPSNGFNPNVEIFNLCLVMKYQGDNT